MSANYITLTSEIFDTENNTAILIGEGIQVNYSWQCGGTIGDEYGDTFNGSVIFNGVTFHLYRHWSVDGAFGLFADEDCRNAAGSFDFKNGLAEIFIQK